LLSGNETFCFAINGSFRSGVLPDGSRKPSLHSGRGGRCIKEEKVYMRQFGRSVGHPTYMEKSASCARPISEPSFEVCESFTRWSRFVRRDACASQR
jgi:hypothetical protein